MKSLIFIQAIVAFGVGLGYLFLVYSVLNNYLRRRFGIDEVNTAYATFQAGIILATANLMSSVVAPGLNAIRFIAQQTDGVITLLYSAGYLLAFFAIGILASLLVVSSSVLVFFQLTKINEMDELKRNNIATSLISAALIVGLSIFLKDYVGQICETLVPYPKVLHIR